MSDFLSAVAPFVKQSPFLAAVAAAAILFSGYLMRQLYQERADRKEDRKSWARESDARQESFAELTGTLNEIKTAVLLSLEVMRERRR